MHLLYPLNTALIWDLNLLLKKFGRGLDSKTHRYYKTRKSTDWEKYRVMQNRVVTIRRNAMNAHFKHLRKEKKGDQKKVWSTIKPYVNSRKNAYSEQRTNHHRSTSSVRNPE